MSRLPHPLAIYIHWPFCARICSYCDFVKYKAPSWLTRNYDQSTSNPTQTATGNYTVTRDQVGFDKILATYQKDIFRHSSKLSQSSQPSWRVSSIFFGGGTPSLAPPAFVEQLLSFIHQRFDVDPGAEVTLEANPTYLSINKIEGFRNAGINRLSLGVQSLHNHHLEALERDHTAEQALHVLQHASNVFQQRVSADLMYGLPNQTLDEWKHDLNIVLGTGIQHLSLYELTLKPHTKLWRQVKRGQVQLPDDPTFYFTAVTVAAQHGLEQYEASNFAKPGLESRHNQTYWHGGSYIGVGPGAVGCLQAPGPVLAYQQPEGLAAWHRTAEEDFHHLDVIKRTQEELCFDTLAGLFRSSRPICLGKLQTRLEGDLAAVIHGESFATLIDQGLMTLASTCSCQDCQNCHNLVCDSGSLPFTGVRSKQTVLQSTAAGIAKATGMAQFVTSLLHP